MLDNTATTKPTPTEPYTNERGETVVPFRSCYLSITGTAPRCRKVDRHTVNLTNRAVDVDVAIVESEARAILARYKNVQRASIQLNYAERSGGFVTTVIFDERHKSIRLV